MVVPGEPEVYLYACGLEVHLHPDELQSVAAVMLGVAAGRTGRMTAGHQGYT